MLNAQMVSIQLISLASRECDVHPGLFLAPLVSIQLISLASREPQRTLEQKY